MAPTPLFLPGKSHGRRSLVGCTHGVAKSRTPIHLNFSLSCIGEGTGTPLQCSCLENPMGGGAWPRLCLKEANGAPLHYSCLENPMDGGAWPRLCLKEANGTHSTILAWKIPWTEEPGGLPSMGSHRVGHD